MAKSETVTVKAVIQGRHYWLAFEEGTKGLCGLNLSFPPGEEDDLNLALTAAVNAATWVLLDESAASRARLQLAWRYTRFSPRGLVHREDAGDLVVTSVLDWIAQELEQRYP